MKHILSFLFVAMIAGEALAQTTFEVNGLKYTVIDEENHYVSVGKGATSPTDDLEIPSTVTYPETNGTPYTVTSIDENAFCDCSKLTSVIIPNSVTSIGDDAFKNCIGLTSVTIPNSVTSIGQQAFMHCPDLTSVTIPESVTSISDAVFADCSGLTSITIPNSVTSISELAFEGCSKLTSVTIPESVTSIGFNAFDGCRSLTSVTIPNSVTSIGGGVFCNCSGLTEINVESANTAYTSKNGVLFNKDKTTIVCYPEGKTETTYTIPNSVTSIGCEAFQNCSGLTSVTIPNSVTSIGDDAFSGCSNATLYCECEETSKPSRWSSSWNAQTKWGCMVVSVDNRKVDRVTGEITGENYELIDDNGALWFLHDAIDPMVTVTFMPDFGYHWGDGINNRIPRVITEPVTASKTYWSEATARICEEMVDAAVPATCTDAGRTAGEHCSVCNAVLKGLEVIPALGHAYDTVSHASTCTNLGYKELTCTRCNDVIYIDTVAANGHTEVVDAAIAATCTIAGKTEGKHCSVCNETLVAQQEVAATGHNEVVDAAVAATCTTAGKTEGKHCSVCNAVLVAQEDVVAIGHKFEKYTYNNDATTTADGTETAVCERGCGETDTRTAAGTKLAETPEKGTAVAEYAANAINIYAYDNTIVVENATEEIFVYDAMGKLICRDAARVSAEFRVASAGVYIVKTGSVVKRIVINF